jgi:hypothetical protein
MDEVVGLGGLDPAHIWDETSFAGCLDPQYQLGQDSARLNKAMNSIKTLQQTAGQFGFSGFIALAALPLLS